ncbi:rhodanese-like domain-containing protein [Halarcobacter ebronensis]|uniref:Rhodanese n=1 Tax=Halarcobacter ebronensis TaxID=1462615 RepID=A0A4Q1AK42_9BACT|nr:rhodanese-like domain-containing protein [Halarcobacter ebronensis]QKF81708.1 rhodanese-like domain-containing protein [Halarcobacter ebronensis]RXK04614.1 rhodanese [Halarcobacter ebronensis]
MNETIIYPILVIIAFIAYKKYSYYKVLTLVPSLLMQGGQIIDVRTKDEFTLAHKEGSVNIPLDILENRVNELNNSKPIIVCCASGSRSALARRLLITKGFENVHNAGNWKSLIKF